MPIAIIGTDAIPILKINLCTPVAVAMKLSAPAMAASLVISPVPD